VGRDKPRPAATCPDRGSELSARHGNVARINRGWFDRGLVIWLGQRGPVNFVRKGTIVANDSERLENLASRCTGRGLLLVVVASHCATLGADLRRMGTNVTESHFYPFLLGSDSLAPQRQLYQNGM
jgi:hypothetical protein